MPDDFDYDDDLDEDDPQDDEVVQRLRRAQRNAKKEAKQYREEAEAGREARRELVKLQAGLPDTPMVNLFLDTYDGDLTKDAVVARARELQLIGPDPEQQEQQQQLGQVESMMQAHDGGTPPPAPGTNDAVLAEIRSVKTTGDKAAVEIKNILERAGLYRYEE